MTLNCTGNQAISGAGASVAFAPPAKSDTALVSVTGDGCFLRFGAVPTSSAGHKVLKNNLLTLRNVDLAAAKIYVPSGVAVEISYFDSNQS